MTPTDPRSGVELIAAERERQLRPKSQGGEGWDADHDAGHADELALAGACYAAAASRAVPLVHYEQAGGHSFVDMWPWANEFDRRKVQANYVNHLPDTTAERIRFLEKAGALVAAAIDSIQREAADDPD